MAARKTHRPKPERALTLRELNGLVRDTLDASMPGGYWVEAELSELHVDSRRGHCYMTLVEKGLFSNTPVARADAHCWRGLWGRLSGKFERVAGQPLAAGMKVMLYVKADFHEAYGFAWTVLDINAEFSLGDLARRRREIVERLRAAGTFDLQREMTISPFAQSIAVVSSDSAAGYGDFIAHLNGDVRGFRFRTQLFAAVMQGESVESSVIAALNAIARQEDSFDVVVITRGGGAVSDMSGFDTFNLAESVANFPLPVITAIGHDRDECVLDMVANTRVKTPTAAADFLLDNIAATARRIDDIQTTVLRCVNDRLETERSRIIRLTTAIPMQLTLAVKREERRVERLFLRLVQASRADIEREKKRTERLSFTAETAARRLIDRERHHLAMLSQRCSAVDPTTLLKRGYSITTLNGHIVSSSDQLSPGDIVETMVAEGRFKAAVTETQQ